LISEQKQSQWN